MGRRLDFERIGCDEDGCGYLCVICCLAKQEARKAHNAEVDKAVEALGVDCSRSKLSETAEYREALAALVVVSEKMRGAIGGDRLIYGFTDLIDLIKAREQQ